MITPDQRAERTIARITKAVETGRANTPRSVYETANGIYISRSILMGLGPSYTDELYLYANDHRSGEILMYRAKLDDFVDSINFMNEDSDCEMWEAKKLLNLVGRTRFELWWGPGEQYSDMAKFDEMLGGHVVRVDENMKPEHFLNVNKCLLSSHQRTPIQLVNSAA